MGSSLAAVCACYFVKVVHSSFVGIVIKDWFSVFSFSMHETIVVSWEKANLEEKTHLPFVVIRGGGSSGVFCLTVPTILSVRRDTEVRGRSM